MNQLTKKELEQIINEEISLFLKENQIDEAFGDFLLRRTGKAEDSDMSKLMHAINELEQLAIVYSKRKSESPDLSKIHTLLFRAKSAAIEAKNLINSLGE